MAVLASFYTHAARDGVDVADLLASWQVGGSRGGWKPFLHHIGKTMPQKRRAVSLKAARTAAGAGARAGADAAGCL